LSRSGQKDDTVNNDNNCPNCRHRWDAHIARTRLPNGPVSCVEMVDDNCGPPHATHACGCTAQPPALAQQSPAYLAWKAVFDQIEQLRVEETKLRAVVDAENNTPPFQPGV
jgi:hypothetical protein